MNDRRMVQRLMKTFLSELAQHRGNIERDLLALEEATEDTRRAELLDALFRAAHSLKGAAATVKVKEVETTCHGLEEVFGKARSSGAPLEPDVFAELLRMLDTLGEAGQRLTAQEPGTAGTDDAAQSSDPAMLAAVSATGRTAQPWDSTARPTGDGPASQTERELRVRAGLMDTLLVHCSELRAAQFQLKATMDAVTDLRDGVRRWHTERQRARRWSTAARGSRTPGAHAHAPPDSSEGSRLRDLEARLRQIERSLASHHQCLDRSAGALARDVGDARMLPFSDACEGLQRLVRDLTAQSGRRAELVIGGADIRLDRSVLEALRAPVTQLVRNAIAHGIEPAAERRAVGKPEAARITVGAELRGGRVEVHVADDGRGIDMDALRARAQAEGRVEQDPEALLQSIFLPGFSTAGTVTQLAGRGVGLDVVKRAIEQMRGTIEVWSEPGLGTRFKLSLPLTLTTIRALLVRSAGQLFALDAAYVMRALRLRESEIRRVDGRESCVVDGEVLPLAWLSDCLDLPGEHGEEAAMRSVVLLRTARRRAALTVDALVAEQDVTVRSLGARLAHLRELSGAAVTDGGEIALIPDTDVLLERAVASEGRVANARERSTRGKPAPKRILVVDDSATTRTLQKTILEAAGYDAIVAPDGATAWKLLQDEGADLVVSDVDMPNMDGLQLTTAIRGSPRFGSLPVVLVTGQESEHDRRRGLEAGADAYLVKSAFDQKALLDTIAQIL